ncbi:MAG: DUF523 domain-containing protein [Clostridia bacterium]|nr:DUF523 domain-containing protein [Clostridia bacterium]
MKRNLLISACLLGIPCRYDGKRVTKVDVSALRKKYNLIPICPEIYGGLPTPRIPSERVGGRVLMKDGRDVTENYKRGAEASLDIAKANGVSLALLKARSPSCGKGLIYDGSFSGTLTEGDGVAAELLMKEEITVFTEEELDLLL